MSRAFSSTRLNSRPRAATPWAVQSWIAGRRRVDPDQGGCGSRRLCIDHVQLPVPLSLDRHGRHRLATRHARRGRRPALGVRRRTLPGLRRTAYREPDDRPAARPGNAAPAARAPVAAATSPALKKSCAPPASTRPAGNRLTGSRSRGRVGFPDPLLEQRPDRRVGRQHRQQGLPALCRGLAVARREVGGAQVEQRQAVLRIGLFQPLQH